MAKDTYGSGPSARYLTMSANGTKRTLATVAEHVRYLPLVDIVGCTASFAAEFYFDVPETVTPQTSLLPIAKFPRSSLGEL